MLEMPITFCSGKISLKIPNGLSSSRFTLHASDGYDDGAIADIEIHVTARFLWSRSLPAGGAWHLREF